MAEENKTPAETPPAQPAPGKKPSTQEIVDDPSEELKRLQKKISGLENVLVTQQEQAKHLEELIAKAAKTPAPAVTGEKTVLDWLEAMLFKPKPPVL